MTTLSTSDVLDRHLNSFAKYDVAGILADYSSDAILFTPAGPLRGQAAMEPFFQTLVAEFEKPGSTFTIRPRTGMLVVFPGYLQHYVHAYRGTRPRIAIACNLTLSPAERSAQT